MSTTAFVRLRSSRAPYTRGGISFRSTREPLEIVRSALSDGQLAKLKADTAIRVEEFDREDAGAPAGETHIVQAVAEPSLAPEASGVALGSPAAAAGVSTTGDRPLDLQPGAIVEQAAPAGADTLPPGGVADSLLGAEGGETIFAGGAADTLAGEIGDTLVGSSSGDTIVGGAGDTIDGAAGDAARKSGRKAGS